MKYKIRVVPRSSNIVQVYNNPKDVANFLMGRRFSEYIILVDVNYHVKQFQVDTYDIKEIEMRLAQLVNDMIKEVKEYA